MIGKEPDSCLESFTKTCAGSGRQLQRHSQRQIPSTTLLPVDEGGGRAADRIDSPLQRVFRLKEGEIFARRSVLSRATRRTAYLVCSSILDTAYVEGCRGSRCSSSQST